MNLQDQYDDAMFDSNRGELNRAIAKLQTRLVVKPAFYEAQLAFSMPHSLLREGRLQAEGRASRLQARIASWRTDDAPPGTAAAADSELAMAKPKPATVKPPEKFPDIPWKKKPPAGGAH